VVLLFLLASCPRDPYSVKDQQHGWRRFLDDDQRIQQQ